MKTTIQYAAKALKKDVLILVLDKKGWQKKVKYNGSKLQTIKRQLKAGNHFIQVPSTGRETFLAFFEIDQDESISRENLRLCGVAATRAMNGLGIGSAYVDVKSPFQDAEKYFAEGMALSNYQFLKYKTKDAKSHSLKTIKIQNKTSAQTLNNLVEAVTESRNLVNEPLMFLTAPQLAKEIQRIGKATGFKVEVWGKKKITSMKMGGILSVNLGSVDPPTFSIMEWKPKNAVNEKPIVLVGKGVVYDTGGLSLKPTDGMDHMKCDMGGAAAVIGAMAATASNKLPLHVIGLVPATDNRPGLNAYVPGDVITMHSGSTVEVLNTDAEGRMLLADALSYAKRYNPELVIDLATLTGSALRAVGPHGIAMMSTAKENVRRALMRSGTNTYERLVEFPLWREYGQMLNSDIADMKNIGGRFSGAITAGKFLEHFTDYPWIHLDIATSAWSYSNSGYRLKNGTGIGVRLLFDYLVNRASNDTE